MERRNTHTLFSSPASIPKSHVALYTKDIGWDIGKRNLLVEGKTDVDLLELAALCHAKKTQEQLLGEDLKIVAAGYGEMGGVGAVERRFITIHELGRVDRFLPKKERIKLLPIFDDDDAGRKTFNSITQQRHPFKRYVDVFLLRRRYPPVRPGSPTYLDELTESNREWEGMDCEMEDLLSRDFLAAFCNKHPGSHHSEPRLTENGHHFEWTDDGKAKLHRFVRTHAMIDDLVQLVQLLKYIRWIFNLPYGSNAPIAQK
jgi:hypothetical protein